MQFLLNTFFFKIFVWKLSPFSYQAYEFDIQSNHNIAPPDIVQNSLSTHDSLYREIPVIQRFYLLPPLTYHHPLRTAPFCSEQTVALYGGLTVNC